MCSAHPLVLEAALRQGRDRRRHAVLIEATSNQVDQFGGYTGLRPARLPRARRATSPTASGSRSSDLVLGGDHLGPQPLADADAAERRCPTPTIWSRAYVAAGYTKLHLDCSYPCADDSGPLSDEVVAARAARMLAVAEDRGCASRSDRRLRYVIGTEVPVPGGAPTTRSTDLAPTTAERARATLDRAPRRPSRRSGSADIWPQVMALVVQPGVEFDHMRVFDYDPAATAVELRARPRRRAHHGLRGALDRLPDRTALRRSGRRTAGGVLKVGPGLTFAMREALFALAAIENELVPGDTRSSAAGGRRAPDARGSPSSGRATTPGSAEAQRSRPPLQLQRPDALLLAGPADRRRA